MNFLRLHCEKFYFWRLLIIGKITAPTRAAIPLTCATSVIAPLRHAWVFWDNGFNERMSFWSGAPPRDAIIALATLTNELYSSATRTCLIPRNFSSEEPIISSKLYSSARMAGSTRPPRSSIGTKLVTLEEVCIPITSTLSALSLDNACSMPKRTFLWWKSYSTQ